MRRDLDKKKRGPNRVSVQPPRGGDSYGEKVEQENQIRINESGRVANS